MRKKIKKHIYISEDLLLISKNKKTNAKKKCQFTCILIIIIIIIFLISIFFSKKITKSQNSYYDLGLEEPINSIIDNLLNKYTFNLTTKEEVKHLFKYIELSKKDIILNKNSFIQSKKPKISVVISMYNRANEIKPSIRSVQNQNFSELEIIIIDDFSNDNSSSYVKEYQKEDPRIVLLRNKENMGTLYSKSIGVLYAKGKYIQSLDSDDMLCNKNYLHISYNKAIEGNYDYVSSTGLYINEINKNIKLRNPFWVVIWSKLIKKEIYQNSIFKLGIDVLKMKVLTLDDDVIAPYMFLFKKGINLPIIGVAHYIHETQHVYFNAFHNYGNAKKFCRNLMTTVKAFSLIKDMFGSQYRKHLLDNFFKNGICPIFINKKEITSILGNLTKE